MRSSRERPATGGSRPWRSATVAISRSGTRERPARGGRVVRGEAGSRWLGVAEQELGREQRQRKRAEIEELMRVLEGKWFTENFFVNCFLYFP